MTSEGFWLLTRAMFGNIAEDRRAATISSANGIGIGMGGEKAYAAWQAENDAPAPMAPTESKAAARQLGAVMRLQALYGRQANPALRGAIKFRKPD